MTITLRNPAGLPATDLYRQVSIATGSRLVFVAGQVARDAAGNRIGEGDLAAQVEQCYLNVHTALAEAGATFDDVAKLTVYLTDLAAEKLPDFADGVARAAARLGPDAGSPAGAPLTGVGVAALAEPDLLVEVEAVAVVDG